MDQPDAMPSGPDSLGYQAKECYRAHDILASQHGGGLPSSSAHRPSAYGRAEAPDPINSLPSIELRPIPNIVRESPVAI